MQPIDRVGYLVSEGEHKGSMINKEVPWQSRKKKEIRARISGRSRGGMICRHVADYRYYRIGAYRCIWALDVAFPPG